MRKATHYWLLCTIMLMMFFCHKTYAAAAAEGSPARFEQAGETAALQAGEEQKTEETELLQLQEREAEEPDQAPETANLPETSEKDQTPEAKDSMDPESEDSTREPLRDGTDPETSSEEEDPCAQGHDYVCVVEPAPTGQEAGRLSGACSRCGAEVDVVLPALNEEDYDHDVITAPTCRSAGLEVYTWKVTEYGEYSFSVEIPAAGHHYEDTVIQPSCESEGYTEHLCTECGDSYRDEFVDPLGHEFGEWIVEEEGSCPNDGTEYRVCTRCGERETRIHLAPDHLESEWIVDQEPTCTESGFRHTVCENCGEILREDIMDPLGHDYVDKVTKPTCTEKGYTTHTCARCGDVLKDSYTAALGHKWGEWVVTKDPTYTETGLKKRTCKRDASHVETKTIAKLAKPRIGHAIRDENGNLRGGKAGDQTGTEVTTRAWYKHYKGWIVIRAKNPEVREMIARNMEYACANDKIGYNNGDCYSLYFKARKVGYDCSLVDEACNTDCSRLVRVCLLYAGIYVPRFYTGTELKTLRDSGHFTVFSAADYTEGMDYLLRGDILVTKVTGHTVVVLNRGVYGKDTTKVPKTAPKITSQPVDREVWEGDMARFYLDAEGTDLIYRWYYRPNKNTQWTLVTSSLGKDPHYRMYAETRHNGYQYRCDVIDAGGQHVYSDIVTLKVRTRLEILTQPEDVTVIGKGTKGTAIVDAKGDGMRYAWYVRDPGDAAYKKSAVTGNAYSIGVTPEKNGRKVYCVITDMYGNTVRSRTVTLKYVLIKPKITEQPVSKTVKTGSQVTFRTAAEGGRSYQWSYRTSPKGTWTKVKSAGGTAEEYTFTASGKQNGWQYRCSITNASGTVHTDTVKLTVVTSKPSITSNPADKTVRAKRKATFKVSAKGTALYYQWYFRTSSRAKWRKVTAAGFDKAAYTVTATRKRSGYQYRCVVTNLMGSVTSRAAKLKVR